MNIEQQPHQPPAAPKQRPLPQPPCNLPPPSSSNPKPSLNTHPAPPPPPHLHQKNQVPVQPNRLRYFSASAISSQAPATSRTQSSESRTASSSPSPSLPVSPTTGTQKWSSPAVWRSCSLGRSQWVWEDCWGRRVIRKKSLPSLSLFCSQRPLDSTTSRPPMSQLS